MIISNAMKNLMLDQWDESLATGADFGSLHTAYSTTGTNEVTGGSPAYARKGLTWAAASGGSKALAATLPTWDVPAATTVAWVGFWDAVTAGTFLGMAPAGGGALKPFAVMDDTNDTFYSEAHGYTNGQQVVLWGPNLPPGVAVGTIYFIVGAATDSFQVSATSGGSAVNVTDEGEGFAQLIVPETFSGQGTYSLSAGTIDLAAVA